MSIGHIPWNRATIVAKVLENDTIFNAFGRFWSILATNVAGFLGMSPRSTWGLLTHEATLKVSLTLFLSFLHGF